MPQVKRPASFQQVLDEHDEIRGLISDLRGFLEDNRPRIGEEGCHRWATKLSGTLVELHDQLFRHFRYEASVGLLDKLEEEHPGASRQIATLRTDHDEILTGVRDLMTDTLRYSEGSEIEDPHLRVRLTGILDRLGEHEKTETDLVQRLEYMDLGTGD
jgi:iron-sulfur cluster repair protein YtfE (RIC family)